jgi:hypothetical protein
LISPVSSSWLAWYASSSWYARVSVTSRTVADHALDVRVVGQVGAEDLQIAPGAVGVPEAAGHLHRASRIRAHPLQVGDQQRRVVRVDQVRAGGAEELLGGNLQQRLDARADIAGAPVQAGDRDDVGRVLHERPEPVFLAAHVGKARVRGG